MFGCTLRFTGTAEVLAEASVGSLTLHEDPAAARRRVREGGSQTIYSCSLYAQPRTDLDEAVDAALAFLQNMGSAIEETLSRAGIDSCEIRLGWQVPMAGYEVRAEIPQALMKACLRLGIRVKLAAWAEEGPTGDG